MPRGSTRQDGGHSGSVVGNLVNKEAIIIPEDVVETNETATKLLYQGFESRLRSAGFFARAAQASLVYENCVMYRGMVLLSF